MTHFTHCYYPLSVKDLGCGENVFQTPEHTAIPNNLKNEGQLIHTLDPACNAQSRGHEGVH